MLISMHYRKEDGEFKVDTTSFDHNGRLGVVTLKEPAGQQFEFYCYDRETLLTIAAAFTKAAGQVDQAPVLPQAVAAMPKAEEEIQF